MLRTQAVNFRGVLPRLHPSRIGLTTAAVLVLAGVAGLSQITSAHA